MKKTIMLAMFCAFGSFVPSALADKATKTEASASASIPVYIVTFSGGG